MGRDSIRDAAGAVLLAAPFEPESRTRLVAAVDHQMRIRDLQCFCDKHRGEKRAAIGFLLDAQLSGLELRALAEAAYAAGARDVMWVSADPGWNSDLSLNPNTWVTRVLSGRYGLHTGRGAGSAGKACLRARFDRERA